MPIAPAARTVIRAVTVTAVPAAVKACAPATRPESLPSRVNSVTCAPRTSCTSASAEKRSYSRAETSIPCCSFADDQAARADGQRQGCVRLTRGRRVVEGPEPEVPLGTLVERDEVVAAERPSGMRNRLSLLEIEHVERPCVPVPGAPAMGVPSERADRGEGTARVGVPDAFASNQGLCAPVLGDAAVLEQADVEAASEELAR